MMAPAAQRELPKLAMLRESLLHGTPVQNWVSDWWRRLPIDDRRTLLALAGLDDSAENARRAWDQYLQDHRDTLMAKCKQFLRLLDSVRWV